MDVDELNPEQVTDINKMATTYGMAEGDFVGFVHPFFILSEKNNHLTTFSSS